MNEASRFHELSLEKQISALYESGTFIMSIRYYRYKVNLYLYHGVYFEVFVDHKSSTVEKIQRLDDDHTRMNFYSDQIRLPKDLQPPS
jgi:hypothetical protein